MTHTPSPLISIIVAVYNANSTLQQCIESVKRQTYPNKELIVIDGGSNDNSVAILQANHSNFSYWVSEPDSGVYSAWNKGLMRAKGEWICFLGADDYFWDDSVLERMVQALGRVTESYRVAYGQVMMVDQAGKPFRLFGETWELARKNFNQGMTIPHVGTMHRRSLFSSHGKFDESFHIAGDYELLLRELITRDAVFIPDIIIAAQRLGGISTDVRNELRIWREINRARRIHRLDASDSIAGQLRDIIEIFLRRLLQISFCRRILDFRRRMKGLPPHWTTK